MPGLAEGGLLGGQPAQLAEHALGVAGRARGVVHDVADGAVGGIGGGLAVAHPGVGAEAGDVAHREADRRGELGLLGGVERHVGEPLVGHEHLGVGVLQDVAHLGTDQVVVDGHQVPAGLQGGQVQLEHLHPVGEQGGHHVARLQVEAPESVHHLVGPARGARPRCTRCRRAPPAPDAPGARAPVPKIRDRPSGPIPRVVVVRLPDCQGVAGRNVPGTSLRHGPRPGMRGGRWTGERGGAGPVGTLEQVPVDGQPPGGPPPISAGTGKGRSFEPRTKKTKRSTTQ